MLEWEFEDMVDVGVCKL